MLPLPSSKALPYLTERERDSEGALRGVQRPLAAAAAAGVVVDRAHARGTPRDGEGVHDTHTHTHTHTHTQTRTHVHTERKQETLYVCYRVVSTYT